MLPSRSAPSRSGCPEQVWLLHGALALPDAPSSSPVPSARSSGRHRDSSGEMGQILVHGSCLAGRWHRGPCQHSTAVCGRSTQGQLGAQSSSTGAAAHGQSLHPQQQLCSVSPSTPSLQSHLSSLGIFGPLGPSPNELAHAPPHFGCGQFGLGPAGGLGQLWCCSGLLGAGLISPHTAAGRTQQHMAQRCRHMFKALQDGILQL